VPVSAEQGRSLSMKVGRLLFYIRYSAAAASLGRGRRGREATATP